MTDEHAVASAIIRLMQGVVYRETDEDTWATLDRQGAGVRDHFATIGIDVVVDSDEGYAFLRSRPEIEGEEPLPRLVRRRTLSYQVSLLLVLLRKRLLEFETSGSEGRLVLPTSQIVEMLRLFSAESTNDARLVDHAEATIKKAAELGFLRSVKGQPDHWEVRRILKAYVDAETLSDFAATLQEYAGAGTTND
ncbi:MAG: DUF4194 domain-containing protein [Actinomycetales bacterium]